MSEPMSAEERQILEKFERGDLLSSANAVKEMETARQAARNTFNKTRRVNLRSDRTRLQPRPCAGTRGRHSVSDALVERHPQIFVRPTHGEAIASSVPCYRCSQGRSTAEDMQF